MVLGKELAYSNRMRQTPAQRAASLRNLKKARAAKRAYSGSGAYRPRRRHVRRIPSMHVVRSARRVHHGGFAIQPLISGLSSLHGALQLARPLTTAKSLIKEHLPSLYERGSSFLERYPRLGYVNDFLTEKLGYGVRRHRRRTSPAQRAAARRNIKKAQAARRHGGAHVVRRTVRRRRAPRRRSA